jgi:hypothetical protein
MKKLMIIGLTVLALTSCNKASTTKDYACDCKVNSTSGESYSFYYNITSPSIDDASSQCKEKANALNKEYAEIVTTVDWAVKQK